MRVVPENFLLQAILFFFCTALHSQQYYSFEFFAVTAEKETHFLQLEGELADDFKAAKKAGKLQNRALIRLWYPDGKAADYNYLVITGYSDFESLEYPSTHVLSLGYDKVAAYRNTYDLVKKEITEVFREHLQAKTEETKGFLGHLKEGNFLFVQYLKVKGRQFDNYLKFEAETWKPIHQANIAKNDLTYWSLFGYWFEQRAIDYDYFSILVYPRFELLKQNIYTHDVWEAVHGKNNAGTIFSKTFELRDEVRAEVWKVLTILGE